MELTLEEDKAGMPASIFWKDPGSWLRQQQLSREYWIFFTAAFFFDAGFSVYFFLFNLYLLDAHFNVRVLGLIAGAMTLGSLAGTLPAGALAARFGERRLLTVCFICAPVFGALRAICMWQAAQIALAFLAGATMCIWGVCYLPVVARFTTKENRTSAFSLIYCVSIGTSALGGLLCGYLPQLLQRAGMIIEPAGIKRAILLASCAIAAVGLFAVRRLPGKALKESAELSHAARFQWFSGWKERRFLTRYLPCMALWSAVLAAFNPFANVYLAHDLHISIANIGFIFSIAQIAQLGMGIVTPVLVRALGLRNAVAVTQLTTALTLAIFSRATNSTVAIGSYLAFSVVQWMSFPGLYNLLMNETPETERSAAASMTMFSNALVASGATMLSGVLITRMGYTPVLMSIAGLAFIAALLFRTVVTPTTQ